MPKERCASWPEILPGFLYLGVVETSSGNLSRGVAIAGQIQGQNRNGFSSATEQAAK
jgi:hypothetical protein